MNKVKTWFGIGYFAVTSFLGYKLVADEPNKYFSANENKEYMVGSEPMDCDNNGSYECLLASYDMNKNGVVDTYAAYIVGGFKPPNDYLVKDKAYAIGVDFDENGSIDAFIIDSDGDGTLDKEVDLKKNKKPGFKTI